MTCSCTSTPTPGRSAVDGGSCYAYVEDAQALHDEWASLVVPTPPREPVTEPVDTDYGIREFAVVDRSGNLVRWGHPA